MSSQVSLRGPAARVQWLRAQCNPSPHNLIVHNMHGNLDLRPNIRIDLIGIRQSIHLVEQPNDRQHFAQPFGVEP